MRWILASNPITLKWHFPLSEFQRRFRLMLCQILYYTKNSVKMLVSSSSRSQNHCMRDHHMTAPYEIPYYMYVSTIARTPARNPRSQEAQQTMDVQLIRLLYSILKGSTTCVIACASLSSSLDCQGTRESRVFIIEIDRKMEYDGTFLRTYHETVMV